MKQLKVLFVDDESIVISDLLTLINWEENNCQVVGWAYSAPQALKLVKQHQPNLIFMDISLPGMDGIELSEQIQKILPSVTIVILSGFMDFTYAQRAIDLGIFTYLVKHELTPQKLEDTISKVRQKIDKSEHELSLIRRHIMEEFVHKKIPFSELSEQQHSYFYAYEMPFLMVMLTAIRPFFGMYTEPWSVPWEDLTELSNQLQIPNIRIIDLIPYQDHIILTLHLSHQSVSRMETNAKIREITGAFQSILKQAYHYDFFAVFLPHFCTLHEFLKNFEMLDVALMQYPFYKNTYIVPFDQSPQASITPDLAFINKTDFENQYDNMKAKTEEIFQLSCDTKDATLFCVCMGHLIKLFREYHVNLIHNSSNSSEITNLYQADQIQAFLLDQLEYLHQNQSTKESYSASTNYVIQYIEKNYNNQPSLGEVAEQLHSNSMYIGQKFKKETGKTFHDFLTECRIKHAKILLSTTNLKMFEITERIGVSNSQYFSKIFKEITGKTPNEYRNETTGK
jgi:two-component system response regulator YesN